MKALAIPNLEDFLTFLLAKRQFLEKSDGKEFVESSEVMKTGHNHNLRPRKDEKTLKNKLIEKPRELVIWLQKQVQLQPERSPVGLLRHKMFGHKPHPDTNICELIKSANLKNAFFRSRQETLS